MNNSKEVESVDWEEYVRSEVNALLNIYLPNTETGDVGVRYLHPAKAIYETHTEYDNGKISGVEVRLVFKFIEDLEIKDLEISE